MTTTAKIGRSALGILVLLLVAATIGGLADSVGFAIGLWLTLGVALLAAIWSTSPYGRSRWAAFGIGSLGGLAIYAIAAGITLVAVQVELFWVAMFSPVLVLAAPIAAALAASRWLKRPVPTASTA